MITRDDVKIGDYVKGVSGTTILVTQIEPQLKGKQLVNGIETPLFIGGVSRQATVLEVLKYRLNDKSPDLP